MAQANPAMMQQAMAQMGNMKSEDLARATAEMGKMSGDDLARQAAQASNHLKAQQTCEVVCISLHVAWLGGK